VNNENDESPSALPPPAPLEPIEDLTSLERALGAAVQRLGSSFLYWRGHGDTDYPLIAGVFRGAQNREASLILHFSQRAASRRGSLPSRDAYIDWLLIAQHYGLPTRLLDWSRSALVALFFAVERDSGSAGCLYALNPSELNSQMSGFAGIATADNSSVAEAAREAFRTLDSQMPRPTQPLQTIALGPIETDLRMLVQNGVFTIHRSAQDLNGAPNHERFLVKFEIPETSKPGLRWTLQRLGITRSALFPDLESLAAELRAQSV
jgi:hypothetical protein